MACDPWLSPREAAELLLDHATFPRSTVQTRTLQKQICGACAEHMADLERPAQKRTGAGIACDRIGRTYRFRSSELERWCRRRANKGEAYTGFQAPRKRESPALERRVARLEKLMEELRQEIERMRKDP